MSTLAEKLAAARKLKYLNREYMGLVVLREQELCVLLDVAEAAQQYIENGRGIQRLVDAFDRLAAVLPEPVAAAEEP